MSCSWMLVEGEGLERGRSAEAMCVPHWRASVGGCRVAMNNERHCNSKGKSGLSRLGYVRNGVTTLSRIRPKLREVEFGGRNLSQRRWSRESSNAAWMREGDSRRTAWISLRKPSVALRYPSYVFHEKDSLRAAWRASDSDWMTRWWVGIVDLETSEMR